MSCGYDRERVQEKRDKTSPSLNRIFENIDADFIKLHFPWAMLGMPISTKGKSKYVLSSLTARRQTVNLVTRVQLPS